MWSVLTQHSCYPINDLMLLSPSQRAWVNPLVGNKHMEMHLLFTSKLSTQGQQEIQNFCGKETQLLTVFEGPNETNKPQRELRNQSSPLQPTSAILTIVLPWGGCSASPWVSGWVQPHLVHIYPVLLGASAFWTEQERMIKDCQKRKVIILYYLCNSISYYSASYLGFLFLWSIFKPLLWAKTYVMWGVVDNKKNPYLSPNT